MSEIYYPGQKEVKKEQFKIVPKEIKVPEDFRDSSVSRLKKRLKDVFNSEASGRKGKKIRNIIVIALIGAGGFITLRSDIDSSSFKGINEFDKQPSKQTTLDSRSLMEEKTFEKFFIISSVGDGVDNSNVLLVNQENEISSNGSATNLWESSTSANLTSNFTLDSVKKDLEKMITVANFKVIEEIDLGAGGKIEDLTQRFSQEEQKIVWALAQKFDLSPSLLLAQLFKETSFDNKKVGLIDEQEIAFGYPQFNKKYFGDLLKYLGWINEFNQSFQENIKEKSTMTKEDFFKDFITDKINGLFAQAKLLNYLINREVGKIKTKGLEISQGVEIKLGLAAYFYGSCDKFIKNGIIDIQALDNDGYVGKIITYANIFEKKMK